MDFNKITNLLKQEVIPAIGCTEPIAIAMAAAKGASYLKNPVEKVNLILSKNIIKNAMSVGIPGTGECGISIAAALGVIAGNADLNLEVLRDCNKEDVKKANDMVNNGDIVIEKSSTPEKLYIEVCCSNKEEESKVIIKDKHTNIVLIEVNGEVVFQNTKDDKISNNVKEKDLNLSISTIYEYATKVDYKDIEFLLEGAEMNRKVAEEGLEHDYGLKIGKTLMENIKKGILADDIMTFTMAVTAAGSDARMSGCTLPVMSTSGSGNQGLTAILPVVAANEKLKKNDEILARALAISHLTTYYIKSYLGRLSALCGCGVAAAIGASAAITYLMDGKLENICYTINNMIGDLSGMICDGAKPGCALKLSTAVSAAVQSALISAKGIEISEKDGIVAKEVDASIRNLANIANNGMNNCDDVILDIMICK